MKICKLAATVIAILTVLVGLSLAFAPVVYAEMFLRWYSWAPWPPELIARARVAGPSVGSVVDGYWRVQKIAPDTYAIGEPQDDPDNYEYLLVGKTRALLIDAGATGRDIRPALATLTQLPVTVIPTHLHSDHTNGLRNFDSIALVVESHEVVPVQG